MMWIGNGDVLDSDLSYQSIDCPACDNCFFHIRYGCNVGQRCAMPLVPVCVYSDREFVLTKVTPDGMGVIKVEDMAWRRWFLQKRQGRLE